MLNNCIPFRYAPKTIGIILILTFQLSSLSAQQIAIAVTDFEGIGISHDDARALTARLRNELFKLGKFEIVERALMENILAEQNFQMTGCTTNDCLVEIGMLLGAEQMVGGTISKLGSTYSISARIVDVESGRIIAVTDYDLNGILDDLLTTGMKAVAFRLSGVEESRISTILPSKPAQPRRPDVWVEKDPMKAFYRSLLIPGSGQLYVDDYTPDRRKNSRLQLGGAAFSWMISIVGYSLYKNEKANADFLFGIDPGGRDSTLFNDNDSLYMNAHQWQEEANVSRSMVTLFGIAAVAVHVTSAIRAKDLAEHHNGLKPKLSLYVSPSMRRPRITLTYRF